MECGYFLDYILGYIVFLNLIASVQILHLSHTKHSIKKASVFHNFFYMFIITSINSALQV